MIFRAAAVVLPIVLVPGLAAAKSGRGEAPAPVVAQAAPASQAVSSQPQQTSATFGDWVLRCNRLSTAPADPQVCEVAEVLRVQGQQAPIAQVAIGRPPAQRPDAARNLSSGLRLTMLLPVNVSFDKAPQLAMDQNDPQPIELSWRRCVPGGCFADAAISDPVLKKLRARKDPMRIIFTNASERELVLPLSPRGLPQALDALAKKNSEK